MREIKAKVLPSVLADASRLQILNRSSGRHANRTTRHGCAGGAPGNADVVYSRTRIRAHTSALLHHVSMRNHRKSVPHRASSAHDLSGTHDLEFKNKKLRPHTALPKQSRHPTPMSHGQCTEQRSRAAPTRSDTATKHPSMYNRCRLSCVD